MSKRSLALYVIFSLFLAASVFAATKKSEKTYSRQTGWSDDSLQNGILADFDSGVSSGTLTVAQSGSGAPMLNPRLAR